MTSPDADEAVVAIAAWTDALKALFDAPVRHFGGEATPLDAWETHDENSTKPFIWLRLARRFRWRSFPAITNDYDPTALPRAASVEAGIARCAVIDPHATFDDYQAEYDTARQDSWLLDQSVDTVSATLTAAGHLVGVEPILPYGPQGRVIAVTTTLYVSQTVQE